MATKEQRKIEKTLETVVDQFERMRLADYVALSNNPWRLLWVNFLAGVGRGLGFAFGASLLAAALLYFAGQVAVLNLPLIGSFITEIVRVVQEGLQR